jgi:hypothetical protein
MSWIPAGAECHTNNSVLANVQESNHPHELPTAYACAGMCLLATGLTAIVPRTPTIIGFWDPYRKDTEIIDNRAQRWRSPCRSLDW